MMPSWIRKEVSPFDLAGGFLGYCIRAGWVSREGSGADAHYYVTPVGARALLVFGIVLDA